MLLDRRGAQAEKRGHKQVQKKNVEKTCLGDPEERNLAGVEDPCRTVFLK